MISGVVPAAIAPNWRAMENAGDVLPLKILIICSWVISWGVFSQHSSSPCPRASSRCPWDAIWRAWLIIDGGKEALLSRLYPQPRIKSPVLMAIGMPAWAWMVGWL